MGIVLSEWVLQASRVNKVNINQVRNLRKRRLLGGYVEATRVGTYWASLPTSASSALRPIYLFTRARQAMARNPRVASGT